MLPLQNPKPDLLTLSLGLQAESVFWDQLVQFSFDMGSELSDSLHNESQPRNTRQTRSASVSMAQPVGGNNTANTSSDVQDAALLTRFATAAGIPYGLSHPYGSPVPPGGYPDSSVFQNNTFNHGNMGNNQLPPLSSLDFPWNNLPPHSYPHQIQFPNPQRITSDPGASPYVYATSSHAPDNPHASAGPSASRQSRRSSIHSPTSPSTGSPDPENQTEAERIAISEEKRRRNTAASARFRIKKKQRAVNLERSVSDLKGRAEDLEREAADLRRENGWLKEIVMLKGSRLAAINLASHMTKTGQRHMEEPSPVASGNSPSSEDNSLDEKETETKKSKGKSRQK